jgi:hypothetical protein
VVQLKAIAPTPVNNDTSLPDPERKASGWAAGFAVVAVALAVLLNLIGLRTRPFDPGHAPAAANLALFAGLYIGAQVVERLAEYVAPFVPWWTPTAAPPPADAALLKADRAKLMLGITFLMGVGASCGFGLQFLQAIGMTSSRTVDCLVSAMVIAGGTKGVHDFLSLIQNASNPKTGSTAS